jgi:hypothetical protein
MIWRKRQFLSPRPEQKMELLASTLPSVALALVGFCLGFAAVTVGAGKTELSAAFVETDGYRVWRYLIASQAAFWGAVALPLWQWRQSLVKEYSIDSAGKHVGIVASAMLVIFGSLVLVSVIESPHAVLVDQQARIFMIVFVGYVVMLPAVTGLIEARMAANPERWKTELNAIMPPYHHLQDHLRGFLTVLGGMIALIVLTTGALANAIADFRPEYAQPREGALVNGAFFAGAVAFLYLPAYVAVQRRGEELLDRICPLRDPNDEKFLDNIERRAKLADLLRLGSTPRENLEKGIIILAPLLTGLVSAFLPDA